MSNAPWTQSLTDYLGAYYVETECNDFDLEFSEHIRQRILSADRSEFTPARHPWRPDITFLKRPRQPGEVTGALLLENARTGQRVGGAASGSIFVLEEWRGERIGVEAICFSDMNEGFALSRVRYSLSGFNALKAAHILHVQRAYHLDKSLISEEVLSWYDINRSGNFKPARSWTADDQNNRTASIRIPAHVHRLKKT